VCLKRYIPNPVVSLTIFWIHGMYTVYNQVQLVKFQDVPPYLESNGTDSCLHHKAIRLAGYRNKFYFYSSFVWLMAVIVLCL
jgi:hypothetical protein